MEGQMDGWMDVQMGGWMEIWVDGEWVNGWTDE